jgi:deazaflavin-dependent oxidoreductase (nitroreductase family)
MVLRKLGVKTHLATTLETTGRRSAQPRQIPVAASIDADGAWIISQHGHRSGWAINIAADPRVRIKDGDEWRSGIAEFRPDDDVHARMNRFAANPVLARLNASGFRALASDPISVRIRFDDSL